MTEPAPISGTVLSVQLVTLGDQLVADAPAGSTTIVVDDLVDFDADGGTLAINGQTIGYTAIDDDADNSGTASIFLSTGLAAAAVAGDRVDVWDVALGGPAVEFRALVEAPGIVDNDDALDVVVAAPVATLLPEGIRDPGAGESVTLQQQGGDWVIVDVRGKLPQLRGDLVAPASIPRESLDFTFGDGTKVTVGDVAPDAPNDGDLWLDSANGNTLHQFHAATTSWDPYQFGGDAIAPGSITTEHLVSTEIITGALKAASIESLSISSATIAGHMIGPGSDIRGTDFIVDANDGRVLVYQQAATVVPPLTGSGTWQVPAGVTSLKVEVWAGGGGGGGGNQYNFGSLRSDLSGGGGGGGEYAREDAYPVTPLASLPFSVGGGGVAGAGGSGVAVAAKPGGAGGSTYFDNVTANGGKGGKGATTTANGAGGAAGSGSTNAIHYSGGSGSENGGGGSSGGTGTTGKTATTFTGAAAVTGGGKGGNGATGTSSATAGTAPGGGAGGGTGVSSFGAGAVGGAGKISLTYYSTTLVASIAAQPGVDKLTGTAYPAGIKTHRADLVESPAPTGSVTMFAGATIPAGYLLCDGRTVSRTTYAALYAALGGSASPYGQGDGSTTFTLPDFRSAFPRGNTRAASGGADTHSHPLGAKGSARIMVSGTAVVVDTAGNSAGFTPNWSGTATGFARTAGGSAPASSAALDGTTDPASNVPAYVGLNFIIKA